MLKINRNSEWRVNNISPGALKYPLLLTASGQGISKYFSCCVTALQSTRKDKSRTGNLHGEPSGSAATGGWPFYCYE